MEVFRFDSFRPSLIQREGPAATDREPWSGKIPGVGDWLGFSKPGNSTFAYTRLTRASYKFTNFTSLHFVSSISRASAPNTLPIFFRQIPLADGHSYLRYSSI